MSTPKVTVIMPSYNVAPYIEASVRSVVEQTFPDWELLIIDDCSKDDSYDIACRLAESDARIRVLKNEKNSGVSKTRNFGISQARGEYVALLDSDDQWCKEKLEKQLALLAQKKAQICYTSYAMQSDKGEKVHNDYIVPPETDYKKMLLTNVIGCSTVILPTDIAKKHPFDETYYHEDYVLWLTLLQAGYQAAGCVEPLVQWRLIENSRSFDKRKSAKNRWLIYRQYLKLPVLTSAWYFAGYTVAGFRKYLFRR
jgi:glycosyltransferase involved in cell wall biosynthesis